MLAPIHTTTNRARTEGCEQQYPTLAWVPYGGSRGIWCHRGVVVSTMSVRAVVCTVPHLLIPTNYRMASVFLFSFIPVCPDPRYERDVSWLFFRSSILRLVSTRHLDLLGRLRYEMCWRTTDSSTHATDFAAPDSCLNAAPTASRPTRSVPNESSSSSSALCSSRASATS